MKQLTIILLFISMGIYSQEYAFKDLFAIDYFSFKSERQAGKMVDIYFQAGYETEIIEAIENDKIIYLIEIPDSELLMMVWENDKLVIPKRYRKKIITLIFEL